MNQSTQKTPVNILLSTDLGPRSDRALERSFYLADQWKAKLTIAHAIEFDKPQINTPSWRQEENRSDILKQRLIESFQHENRPLTPEIIIAKGAPDEVVLNTAKQVNSDFIITGVAKSEPFGRGVLGETVGTLTRKAECPVLTVKKRLPLGYRHIAIGIDMSDFSKNALMYAVQNFPKVEKISLIHAVNVPFQGMMGATDERKNEACNEARSKCEIFCADFIPEKVHTTLVVDEGLPSVVVTSYADDTDVDLIIIGRRGQGGLLNAVLGSAAVAILESAHCDVLVVR